MAYTYSKMTTIAGYTIQEPNPYSHKALGRVPNRDEMIKGSEWQDKYYKTYCLSGHWSIDAIKRFIAKRNLHHAKASHSSLNISKPGFMNERKDLILC